MQNKIQVLQSNYSLEGVKRPVIFTDINGVEYRVQFEAGGGIVINKSDGAILIKPSASNEIKVY